MKIIIRASAIVIKDRNILLCRRSKHKEHYPDSWTIPGGELIDPGISFSEYLSTRVKDLLGLDFVPEKKLWFYETITEKIHAVGHAFLGTVVGEGTKVDVNQDHNSDFGWFSFEKISDLDLAFSDWEIIEDLAQEGLL